MVSLRNKNVKEIIEDTTSIIIIALNGLDYTKRCIESIRKYTNLPYELIVIDNGSTDGTLEYLKSQKGIKLIANTENVGAPFARNQGLQIAKGGYIMFFDNDIVATKNWLNILIGHAKNNPEIGLIGPVSNYVSGPQFVPNSNYDNLNEMQDFAEKLSSDKKGRLTSFPRLILFAMFAKREVVERIGGFDPLYGKWGFEDDDYCLRALIAGFKLAIAEDVFIYHKGSSTSQSANIDYSKLLEENWENFKRKWGLPKYLSYMQGYPIDALSNQPFDKEKHYCSLTNRRSSLMRDLQRQDTSSIFIKSKIEELDAKQKEQFVLFNAIDECEGNVLETGYPTPDLAVMIAAGGLDITRLSENLEDDSKYFNELGLDNLTIERCTIDDFSDQKNLYDTALLYFDEKAGSELITEHLNISKEIIKPAGKIVAICKTNYQTHTNTRNALRSFGDVKFNDKVAATYILATYKKSGAPGNGLIIKQPKKTKSEKKVAAVLLIDGAFDDDFSLLPECINNMFSQTYGNVEFAVCNLTENIEIKKQLKPYLDKLNYIESRKTTGEVLRLLVDNLDCDYLTFLTPDELLMPKAIEVRVNALAKSDCDAVCTDAVYFIEKPKGIRLRWSAKTLMGGRSVQDQLLGNRVFTPASLIKRTSLQKLLEGKLSGENFQLFDINADFQYAFWLFFLAGGLSIKAINIPTVAHKLTKYEEIVFQGNPQQLESFSQLQNTDRSLIVKKFIENYSVDVLLPNKISAGNIKSQVLSALEAFRASVLMQNKLYKEAAKDIANAIKKKSADTGLKRDIKELSIFLFMKAVELNDFDLIENTAKLVLKIDSSNALARLHLLKVDLEKCFDDPNINIKKIKKIASNLFSVHEENKFESHQFLCYGLLAALLGKQDFANNIFSKLLSMNMSLHLVDAVSAKVKQFSLSGNVIKGKEADEIAEKIEELFRDKTLSLIMIVKNEEDNLARCLKSVEGVADEVVIVDTGSTDRTKEIAQSFGAKIIDHKWKGDFSEARNISIDNATSDWVMFLDADEELAEEDRELLTGLKNDPENEGFLFVINNFIGERAGQDAVANLAVRMWRNRPQNRFYGALHEQILDVVQKKGTVPFKNIRINHYGYLDKIVVDKNKVKRNLELAIDMVKNEPKNSFAHYNLGVEYVRARNYQKAYEHFEKSAKCLTDDNAYFAHFLSLNRIQSLRNLERHEDALKLTEEEELKYPDFPELIYNKALIYVDLKDFIRAIETFKYLISLKPDLSKYVSQSGVTTYRAFHSLGILYDTIGDKKSAVSWFSHAFKANPKFTQNIAALARILLKSDDENEVKEYMDKHIDDKDPFLLVELGSIFLNGNKPRIAIDYLNKALSIDEKTPNLYFLLGRTNLYLHDRKQALKFLKKVPATNNCYMEVKIELVFCYGLEGDKINLKSVLDEIAAEEQLSPYVTVLSSLFGVGGIDNGSTFNDKEASIYWKTLSKLIAMQEFDYFEKALKLCARVNLKEGVIVLNLGKLYDEGSFKELAVQKYLDALNKGYCDSESLIALGEECERQGLTQDAINFYGSATQTAPISVTSYLKLVKLLVKQKEYSKAEEILTECNKKFPGSELIKQAEQTLKSIL